jgi:hypothetical protein
MSLFFFIFVFFACAFSMMMMVLGNNERRRREIFLDREFSLEFLHKKERDVYIKDELFFF